MPSRSLLRRVAFARRNRCSVLLGCLILLILLQPILRDSRVGALALVLGLLGSLVVALWALRVRHLRWIALAAVAVVAAEAVALGDPTDAGVSAAALAGAGVFLGSVTIALLRYVLNWRAITLDKVFGAISAYILIAFTFASFFALLRRAQPEAFLVTYAHGPGETLRWADMMYFAFTVLTSTGFGEIVPRTDAARSLVVIEQVLGVMYVAFLVARLANLYGQRR
jgi:hypothetical protein